METNNLPDFDQSTPSEPPAPPKRQRKAAAPKPKPRRASPKAAPAKAIGPKRARKKRLPRKPPGRSPMAEVHSSIEPPMVSPEAAGVIRAYMALEESQRPVVLAYIQALR